VCPVTNSKGNATDTYILRFLHASGLSSLQKLKLNDNHVERIQDGAFAALQSPAGSSPLRVELAENPLRCDCGLAWLLDWAEVALARARCDQPPSLHGHLVRTEHWACAAGWVPVYL
jgi:hypothetical protein